MHRTVLSGLFFLAALPALAGEWSKTFAVSGKPELRVDVNDGAVRVRAGDGKRIEARVLTTGWKIGSDEVRVTDHQLGDRVEIGVRVPRRPWNFGNRSLRIELLVPRQIDSNIRTGDGSISVEGLKGETLLSTGDGRIEADTLDGALEARTGDGSIHVRGRFDRLRVRTGDGGIEAEVQPGSKMAAGWRVHTGDGGVRLRLPEGFAGDLYAHTGDGHVTVDLPVTVTGTQRESTVRGKMNGGGETLTVESGDGSIRLQRW
jgi:hypothetical protein